MTSAQVSMALAAGLAQGRLLGRATTPWSCRGAWTWPARDGVERRPRAASCDGAAGVAGRCARARGQTAGRQARHLRRRAIPAGDDLRSYGVPRRRGDGPPLVARLGRSRGTAPRWRGEATGARQDAAGERREHGRADPAQAPRQAAVDLPPAHRLRRCRATCPVALTKRTSRRPETICDRQGARRSLWVREWVSAMQATESGGKPLCWPDTLSASSHIDCRCPGAGAQAHRGAGPSGFPCRPAVTPAARSAASALP